MAIIKVLITGAEGFVGRNLVAELSTRDNLTIFKFDRNTSLELLDSFCQKAEFVFHLAGVNRPEEFSEFMKGNFGFTNKLLETLKKHNNTCPIMISSSIQATLDNDYGRSKKASEKLVSQYAGETGVKVMVYRLQNVFGKWCRPNYNSVVATFCHNIAHGLPITINNPSTVMNLIYIDDVIQELINAMEGYPTVDGDFCKVPIVHVIKLGEILKLLESFKVSREKRQIPNQADPFIKKLYSTYLSYLSTDNFCYDLKMNVDHRGSFTEFIKTPDRGQVSVNISKPNVTKGNHWHHSKNEKFLVVSGEGVIRFRALGTDEVIEYFVSGKKLQVVDVPVGYTHHIENLGESDMVTLMWVNEIFDPSASDTYFLEV